MSRNWQLTCLFETAQMKLFSNKKRPAELVTAGQFELEREGKIATLQYTLAGNVLALLHSEIPESLRGTGMASALAKTALDWARENKLKVDVVCPFVAGFMRDHPEYSDLVLK
jgi:hypothetical protein